MITLENGAEVLYCYLESTPEWGMRDCRGLALCRSTRNELVVWSISKDLDDEKWNAESGDYFGPDDREKAMHMFGLRLARHLPNYISRQLRLI